MADPRFRLDEGTADRLLDGRVAPDDAPPGYAEVAGLLRTLAADLPSRPAAAGEGTVRMMARVVGISDRRRPRRRPRSVRGRIVAFALVGSLGTTGVAFAGGLPDAAQRVVWTWFERIGVTIPHPGEEPDPYPAGRSGTSTHAPATEASATDVAAGTTPRRIGDREDHRSRAAGPAGAPRTGVADDDAVAASSRPSDPPIHAPNDGGTGTADDASGAMSTAGTSTADERSVGSSAAGSNNAGSIPSMAGPGPGAGPSPPHPLPEVP